MDITIKDVPKECEEAIRTASRETVYIWKLGQMEKPQPNMKDFDTANKEVLKSD